MYHKKRLFKSIYISLLVLTFIFILCSCAAKDKYYKYSGKTYDDSYDYKNNYGYIYLKEKNNEQAKLYEELYLKMVDFSHSDLDVEDAGHRSLFYKEDLSNNTLTSDDIHQVFILINIENPKFYWLSSSVDENDSFCIGVYSAYMDKNIRKEKNKKINEGLKKIDKLVKGLDEFDKIKVINDYIVQNMKYAYEDGKPSNSVWAHNIVGFFDNNEGVCETYAKTFKLLCDRYNIGNIPLVSIDHIWNLVLYENKWYVFDLTYDEGTYLYFGKTEAVYELELKNDESHDYDLLLYPIPENMAKAPLSLGEIELKEGNKVITKSHSIDTIYNSFNNGKYEIVLNYSDLVLTKFFINNIDSNYDTLTISYNSKDGEYGVLDIESDITLTKDLTLKNLYIHATSKRDIILNGNTIYLENISLHNLVNIEGDNIVYID